MKNLITHQPGSSKLFLEMPHSGRVGIGDLSGVPSVLVERLRFSSAEVRATIALGCDVAVPEMTGFDERRNDPTISTLSNDLARVYTDPNRNKAKDVSGRVHPDYDPMHAPHGVIWARTAPRGLNLAQERAIYESEARKKFEDIYDKPLTKAEFDALMAETYDPYHAYIREAHETIREQQGEVVHLALHTFPPVLGVSVDGAYCMGQPARPGRFSPAEGTFPDLILIHNAFKAADPKYVEIVRRHFEAQGLVVQDGFGPFVGDTGVTALYGDPANGVHVIGIEHVPHNIEVGRHLGLLDFDETSARKHRPMYNALFDELAR